MANQIQSLPATTSDNSSAFVQRIQSVRGSWRRLSGDSRSIVAAALIAALVAVGVVLMLWASGRQMVPLYGHQEQYDTAAIVEVLEAQGIKFELDSRTGNVLVDKSKVAAARMQLAAGGVTAKLPVGMESLDGLSSLSTSQFMESSRYTFAIEGELARSILTLNQVRNARVHLAIPQRTLFVGREEQTPTASVVVDIVRTLDETQVEAIVNMVAAGVPGMKPGSVSVVDQNGKLLSAGVGEESPGRVSNRQMDYVTRLEEKIARSTSDMLVPMVGRDNFRIRVSADVDFSQVEETRETLSNEPVLLTETTLRDSTAGQLALGIPGALANQPPIAANVEEGEEGAAAAAGNEQEVNRREENTRRFGTGKAITHTRNQEARVRKLSVSVLINDAAAQGGAWAPADMAKMSDIVQTAAGLDMERGDIITLQSAPFVIAPTDFTADGAVWWQELAYWEDYIRYAVGALLMLMLIMFGIRPLVKYLTDTNQGRAVYPANTDHDGAYTGEDDVPLGTTTATLTGDQPAASIGSDGALDQSTISLPPPGSGLDVQLEHLRLLADKETTRVAEVIKTWVHESGNKAS